MRFVDYKCKDCENISEIVIKGDNSSEIKCEKCGSKNMVKIFTPVGFKSSAGSSDFSSSSSCSSSLVVVVPPALVENNFYSTI